MRIADHLISQDIQEVVSAEAVLQVRTPILPGQDLRQARVFLAFAPYGRPSTVVE
jgi:hypothetical protein